MIRKLIRSAAQEVVYAVGLRACVRVMSEGHDTGYLLLIPLLRFARYFRPCALWPLKPIRMLIAASKQTKRAHHGLFECVRLYTVRVYEATLRSGT